MSYETILEDLVRVPCIYRGNKRYAVDVYRNRWARVSEKYSAYLIYAPSSCCEDGPVLEYEDQYIDKMQCLTLSGLQKIAPYTPWCEEIREYVFDARMMGGI